MKNNQTNSNDLLKVITFLNDWLPAVDSSIPTRINEGGCGIFAYEFIQALKKIGIKGEAICYFMDHATAVEERVKNFNSFLNNTVDKIKLPCTPEHILVNINGIYFDSTGILSAEYKYTAKSFDVIPEEKLNTLDHLAAGVGCWNTVFDRECIPLIREKLSTIKEDFEYYCKGGTFKLSDVEYSSHTQKELMISNFFRG